MATRSDDPIKHVVVLMLENQSFDRTLGALSDVHPGLDGVSVNNLYSNEDAEHNVYTQAETRALRVDPDPKHELKNVLRQIEKESEIPLPTEISVCRRVLEWTVAVLGVLVSYLEPKKKLRALRLAKPYQGAFILDYATDYPASSAAQRQEIMGYYPLGFLPAIHALARAFTACDRWFSSVPGPTWANRFFVHSGTSLGRIWMPDKKEDIPKMRPYDQVTLYDRLNEQKVSWLIYFGDIPQTLVMMHQLQRENIVKYRPMTRFYEDAKGKADDFPEYCFIEPRYFDSTANDDHPPHNTFHAQCLVADVYNALRRNKELWSQTLFVVMYDEHGGLFDHVEPPLTVCPDGKTDEYGFGRLGVRVPVVLASPWVAKGVISTEFDHTSLLKYLSDKWNLGSLGKRVANVNSIRAAIEGVRPVGADALPEIPDSPEMIASRREIAHPDAQPNGHQLALLVLSRILALLLDTGGIPAILHAHALGAAPTSEVDDAKQVVERLIQQEWEKAQASARTAL